MQDIAEHLTTIHLSRCGRGKRCLYEGSTPSEGFPNNWVSYLFSRQSVSSEPTWVILFCNAGMFSSEGHYLNRAAHHIVRQICQFTRMVKSTSGTRVLMMEETR
jgi:hypothetical protein